MKFSIRLMRPVFKAVKTNAIKTRKDLASYFTDSELQLLEDKIYIITTTTTTYSEVSYKDVISTYFLFLSLSAH